MTRLEMQWARRRESGKENEERHIAREVTIMEVGEARRNGKLKRRRKRKCI